VALAADKPNVIIIYGDDVAADNPELIKKMSPKLQEIRETGLR